MKKAASYITIIIPAVMLAAMFSGCTGQKKLTEQGRAVELSEAQKREYNYALTEATKQKIFGNFSQAANLYMTCIKVNPASDVAHFQLAGIYLMGRNMEKALAHNRIAAKLDPDNYWYRVQLAQIYTTVERPDSAILVYEGIAEKWPDKIEIRFETARLYSESGKNGRALKILDAIEKENGISEKVSLFKEQIYVKEKKYDEAIAELNKLIGARPENINYLGILAELYSSVGMRNRAKETYRKIFSIEPDNGIAQLSMAEFYRMEGDSARQIEYLYMAMNNADLAIDRKMAVIIDFLTNEEYFGRQKDAVDSLISILELNYPEDFRVKTARADYYTKVDSFGLALSVYNDVLGVQKGNYFIWEQSIFIENYLGNPKNVYDKCSEALKYFSDKPFLYLFLGSSAVQLGKNGEAISALEKGLEFIENNIPLTVQFYSMLAEANRDLGNHRKSDEYFDSALKMEPENTVILNNYSYYLSLRGERLEDAEKMSMKTIRAEPENATYLDTYAWILYRSGKYEQAGEYMKRAMQNGGNEDPDIVEHYAEILKAIGDESRADEYMKKAGALRRNEK